MWHALFRGRGPQRSVSSRSSCAAVLRVKKHGWYCDVNYVERFCVCLLVGNVVTWSITVTTNHSWNSAEQTAGNLFFAVLPHILRSMPQSLNRGCRSAWPVTSIPFSSFCSTYPKIASGSRSRMPQIHILTVPDGFQVPLDRRCYPATATKQQCVFRVP